MPIVAAAREVNHRQRDLVVEKLLDELRILKGRTIGLLGLAFKPQTDDLRDAPAIDIARRLIDRGARVRLHDPVAMDRFRREHPDLAPYLCDDAGRGRRRQRRARAGHRVAAVPRTRLGEARRRDA